MIPNYNNPKTEVLINGKKELYDFCHEGELSEAKKRAKEWDCPNYIGSSDTYFINGRMNKGRMNHYFRK